MLAFNASPLTGEATIKRLTLAATTAALMSTAAAQAGGLAEPVLEPEVVVQDASSSAAGVVVPLLLLVLVVAALASRDSAPVYVSDARLKTDIVPTGRSAQGLPIYRYRYTGLPMVYEGVMAQDVARLHPEAIVPLPFGYMAVDYGQLGLTMTRIH